QLYPADRAGHSNLAIAHFFLRNFAKALEEGRRAVDLYPKNETFRSNIALYAMYAGDFEAAAREARSLIEQNPRFAKADLPFGVAALANDDPAAARDAYDRMSKTGPFGASLANTGQADLARYEDRLHDAEAVLVEGVAADERSKNTAGLAAKLLVLADVYAATGAKKRSVDTVTRALKLGKDESIVVPAAR